MIYQHFISFTCLVTLTLIFGFGNYCEKMTTLKMDGSLQQPKFCNQQGDNSPPTPLRKRRKGKRREAFLRSHMDDDETNEEKFTPIKFKLDAKNRMIGYHEV